jgi:uncharacterized protein YdhG (YjbR/CyaY superfamily)
LKAKPETVDEYLDRVDDADKRAALEKLRKIVRAAAPKAIETVTYRVPVFKLNGMLVGFAAAKDHCAFYPCSGKTVNSLKNELKSYNTSKGTIRFQPNNPLPATLVRKIVKIRIAENAAKCAARLQKARMAQRRK